MTLSNWNYPLTSLQDTIACSPRDWSPSEGDAWIYGIVFGWDSAITEVAQKHGWSTETVARLNALHNAFMNVFIKAAS